MKVYSVNFINDENLLINGKGTHPSWEKAKVLTSFVSPWDEEGFCKIEFKALWNYKKLFFCFKVYDSDVYIDTIDSTKSSINNSDRVELFFRKDISLNPYYCLEIDPTARIMDFEAHPEKQFNFNWNWPLDNIKVKSTIESTHFTVEGAISITYLKELGLLKKGKIETGIYRAKYKLKEDGTYQPIWITWVDPKTDFPNFHTPSSFGELKLENFT